MAWINMQTGLLTSRKTIRLAALMGWDRIKCVGFLYAFWSMSLDIYENGYLGDVMDIELAIALGLPEDTVIIEHMIKAGFVDKTPFRIHNWWKNQAPFFKGRYGKNPKRWQEIKAGYETSSLPGRDLAEPKEVSKEVKKKVIKEIKKEVQPKPVKTNTDFDMFYQAYPNKTGKRAALKSWDKVKPVLDEVLKSLDWQKRSKKWLDSDGEFIPMPSTYLNQGRWEDEEGSLGWVKKDFKKRTQAKESNVLAKIANRISEAKDEKPMTLEDINDGRKSMGSKLMTQEEFDKLIGGMK